MDKTIIIVNKSKTIKSQKEITHRFAGFLYWVSLLLLLAGMWVLIDPFNRKPGEIPHIYVTLGSFEIYMWLLLLLGRWQLGRRLNYDAARSSIFALFLAGVQFIALNELHLASISAAGWFSILVVILAIIKLSIAGKWLVLQLSFPMWVFCCIWFVILAVLAPLIRSISSAEREVQYVMVYILFWLIALFIAFHIFLVVWQRRKGWQTGQGPFSEWWVPWLLLIILTVFSITQLVVVTWIFINWVPAWYLSPIFLACGVIAIALSYESGKRGAYAWGFMFCVLFYAALVSQIPVPRPLTYAWNLKVVHLISDPNSVSESLIISIGAILAKYAIHPVYPSGIFTSLLFLLAAILLHRWWLYGLSLMGPMIAAIIKAVRLILIYRMGKGILLLLAAFILLGAGAIIQWLQEIGGYDKLFKRKKVSDENKDNSSGESSSA